MMSSLSGNNITDLLLLLCRDSLTEEEKLSARSIAPSVSDWRSFSDLALKNGVAALIWYNLIDSGLHDFLPEVEKQILEGAMMRTIPRVTFLAEAAAEITKYLSGEGIRPVLLKGLALEHTVYGNRGLRQMSDADILVSPDDCLKAREILQKHGFVSSPLKSPLYKKIIIFIGNHLPEMYRNGISIDIHHRLFGLKGTEITRGGIERAETIEISGTTCYILPPGIAFLGMIKHLQKHDLKGDFQVRLFTDLYLMLKYHGDKIISEDVNQAAADAGISIELAKGLFLVSRFWNFPVPEKYTSSLTLEEKETASSKFLEDLKNPGVSASGRFGDLYKSNINAIPGFINKLIFLLGDIFPSLAFMKRRYNCKTLFCVLLHYPFRLGKIFWFIDSLFKR